MLRRPSPQIPVPSAESACICFDSAQGIIKESLVELQSPDTSWIFLLTLYMAINATLWAVSYPEVRAKHNREEVKELMESALLIMNDPNSQQRWPGTAEALTLYEIFSHACLQSYDEKQGSTPRTNGWCFHSFRN